SALLSSALMSDTCIFLSSRRRHTRSKRDWSSDVCSSDLATIIPREDHPISRKIISRPALDVLYGLKDAGYEAYLVGGCLRDALKIGRASCRERVLVLEPAGSLQHDKTA